MIEMPCPLCGADTTMHSDCPGYHPGRGKSTSSIMVCYPPCGNAFRFVCNKCAWWYREPNNRDASKMGVRPDWLDDVLRAFEEAEDAIE